MLLSLKVNYEAKDIEDLESILTSDSEEVKSLKSFLKEVEEILNKERETTYENIVKEFYKNEKIKGGNTYFDGVVLADVWVWESNSSSIMSNNKWNFGFSNELIDNFAKFESSLLSFDSVRLESSFHIIKNSKMLICLFN